MDEAALKILIALMVPHSQLVAGTPSPALITPRAGILATVIVFANKLAATLAAIIPRNSYFCYFTSFSVFNNTILQ